MNPSQINMNDTTPILTADDGLQHAIVQDEVEAAFGQPQIIQKPNGELVIMQNGVQIGSLSRKKISFADRLKQKFQDKRLAEINAKKAK